VKGSEPSTGGRALLTGASSGIGAELAVRMARAGWTVGICARRSVALNEVLDRCRESNDACRSWIVDLRDVHSLEAFAARADEELGGIDLLINNAGIPKRRFVERLSLREAEEVMAVNYFAPLALTLGLLPLMIERGGGRIMNISSIAARFGSPGESAYAASKAALSLWSEASGAELASKNVAVQIVYPGPVDTALVDAPGEDPPLAADAGINRLPVSTAVDAIMVHLGTMDLETWVPAEFREGYVGKVADPQAAFDRAAAWFSELRNRRAGDGAGAGARG